MSVPTALFSFTINPADLLQFNFIDRSAGNPTSWLWDFGFKLENVEQTSTEQNPIITFPEAKTYIVKLVATNTEGSNSYQFEVAAGGDLGISIIELIKQSSPLGFDYNFLSAQIKAWQLFLRNSLPEPIEDADVFNEGKWPTLFNYLIAKLVVYDYVVLNGASAILSSSNTTSQSGGATLTAKGPVKRVETGPSNAEWYNLSEYWSNLLKAGTNGQNIITLMQQEICTLAGFLGVFLAFCPLVRDVQPFQVFHPTFVKHSPAVTMTLYIPVYCWIKPPSIAY